VISIILALTILLQSFTAFAASGRSPASCTTPADLMTSGFQGKDFTKICKRLVEQDPGCKKLKAEKRMNCSSRAANNLLSSNDLTERIGQCIKGFAWDSMVDLAKFVIELIKTMVGAQVSTMTGMFKFLSDSEYREKTMAAAKHGAGSGYKLAKAFLNSASLYFAREFPRNLKRSPFNPMLAVGETLFKPLMNFLTESVQQIAAYYIPQYQCMNGTAKLYTVCRTMGEFIMPPTILFTFLKSGVNGLRLLKTGADAAKISRVERRFSEANELREATVVVKRTPDKRADRILIDQAPKSQARAKPTPKPVAKKRSPAEVHPQKPAPASPLPKTIEAHTADELIELARSERADIPAAPAPTKPVLSSEEKAAELARDAHVEDLIANTEDLPSLIVKYAQDPEYSSLFKAEKMYPEQSRDLAIVIADIERRSPQMPKSKVRESVEEFLKTCEVRR
jgi:hypothetical protein